MRIGVPIWEERISPVFDTAGSLLVVDWEGGEEKSRQRLEIQGRSLPARLQQLTDARLEILLCGAISRPFAALLTSKGIKLIPFLAGEVEDVLTAYREERLSDSRFRMPGCCGQRRRQRNGCRGLGQRGKGRS